MSAHKFYPLKVKDIRPETADCISVALEVPDSLRELFQFRPGQYLTFRTTLGDKEVRRSYSICSSHNEQELRVAIKRVENGQFTTFAHTTLRPGDTLDTMPPMGNFVVKHPATGHKEYLAFAAGSGITPIMSILKTVLEEEPDSCFTLIYGNRSKSSIIFREAIEALKNKYMLRLRVYHVLSREFMDVSLFNGRIDAAKCAEFCRTLVDIKNTDEAFICGPEEMILSVREQLTGLGMATERVHIELFTSPDQPRPQHEQWQKGHEAEGGRKSKVSITLDGVTFHLEVGFTGETILDAALAAGADLPFACKGGVCCTCRAKVMEGQAEMEVNYALDPHEVDQGYILTCQSHPRTETLVIDFDAR